MSNANTTPLKVYNERLLLNSGFIKEKMKDGEIKWFNPHDYVPIHTGSKRMTRVSF